MTTRVSKEPERPRRFHRNSGWETGTDNSQAPGGTPTTEGSKTRAKRWYRLVKNSKRAEMDGGESERPIVSLKRGNHSSKGPRGEKGRGFRHEWHEVKRKPNRGNDLRLQHGM